MGEKRFRDRIHSMTTAQDFGELCRLHPELRIELTSQGKLLVLSPEGGEAGARNFCLAGSFGSWTRADGTGIGFDSSTCFTLPNGARRSPDLSWIRRERWEALPAEDRRGFAHICPDFVVELRSPSDTLPYLQEKLQEFVDQGAQLGWLIDPEAKKVWVYRPHGEIHCLENPERLSGEPVLPGFVLEMREIWG
jgi:Uma2 family endonuclease